MDWHTHGALHDLHRRLSRIEERLDTAERNNTMTDQSVEALQDAVSALSTAFTTFATDVNTTIDDLKAKEEGGGTITAAELAPITAGLKTLQQSVEAADATVKGEDPGKVTPPAPPAEPTQSVYLFKEEASGATPGEEWHPSGFETNEATPRKLYYYAGDTAGASPFTTAGADIAGWELYTGAVQAVPAA